MQTDIKANAKVSMLWSFLEKVTVQGVGFVINLILARLLLPEDYGNIALLAVLISISQVIIDSGFSSALIHNQNRCEEDYSTVFYINVLIGFFLYTLLYFLSANIADFFNQPILNDVVKTYSIVLIIGSLSIVHQTYCYITYEFKRIALISLVSVIFGGIISIFLAYKGFGIWALVSYYLITASIKTIGLWLSVKWRPTLCFSFKSFVKVYNFGSKLLVTNLIHVIIYNLYTFIIGKFYNAISLGYFSRGQTISYNIPANLSNIMQQASYPVLCNLQYDYSKLRIYFLKYIKFAFMICAPMMTLLIMLATPLVHIILTDKWLPAVVYIQLFAAIYTFDPIIRLNCMVLTATGKTKYLLYTEIIKKIVFVILVVVSSFIGLKAIAISILLYTFFDMSITCAFVNKEIHVNLFDEFMEMLPYFIFCGIVTITLSLVLPMFGTAWGKIVIGGILGTLEYIILIFLFSRSSIMEIKQFAKL